jgi:nucleoid-associated protein YgaU
MAKPTPGSTYEVQQNDSLWKIAVAAYNGDGNQWPRIWNYPENRRKIGNTPKLIQPGWKLFIPPLPSASSSQTKEITDVSSPTPKPGFLYQVKKDDTLSAIALAAYKDDKLWPRIYNYPLNHEMIGNDPGLIIEGRLLYIPQGDRDL